MMKVDEEQANDVSPNKIEKELLPAKIVQNMNIQDEFS